MPILRSPQNAANVGDWLLGPLRNDLAFLNDVGLDPADEQCTVVGKSLHLGGSGGTLEAFHVVIPEFGDAIDFHIRCRDVRATARADDVGLDVPQDTRHGQSQRSVDVKPVSYELFVADTVLPGEKSKDFDHGPPPYRWI